MKNEFAIHSPQAFWQLDLNHLSYLQYFLNKKKTNHKTPTKITPHNLHAYFNRIQHSS